MSQNAKIVKKIVFHTTIETMAPLRISSGTEDGIIDSLIMKDRHGQAFIPATSLGGVLRSELLDIYGEEAVDRLFGFAHGGKKDDEQSMINIGDIMLENTEIIYRDGVKIDEVTGTGVKGAKFDYEAIQRGAHGDLAVEVTIRQYHLEKNKLPQIEYMHSEYEQAQDPYGDMMATIADLLTSGTYLGSLTTKGYGLVKSQKPVSLYTFDFLTKGASDLWLSYLDLSKNIKELKTSPAYKGSENTFASLSKQDLVIQMDFSIKSALIIRELDPANFTKEQEEKRIKAVQMKSKGDYVIPGTSLKGVLRHKAYDILMALTERKEGKVSHILNHLMGTAEDRNGKASKSRFEVSESYIKPTKVKGIQHARNRIDRFTGSTVDNALYSDEPIWQSEKDAVTVPMRIRVKRCSKSEAGLVLLLLKDLWLGNLPVGGNKGIGRGVLQGRFCQIAYQGKEYRIEEKDAFTVTGDKNQLEEYVTELVGECNG